MTTWIQWISGIFSHFRGKKKKITSFLSFIMFVFSSFTFSHILYSLIDFQLFKFMQNAIWWWISFIYFHLVNTMFTFCIVDHRKTKYRQLYDKKKVYFVVGAGDNYILHWRCLEKKNDWPSNALFNYWIFE